MDYPEALAWLYGRQKLGIKLGLGKMSSLLAALGNPQEKFRSVHIAGTNGKGSTAKFLANALLNAGYQVGLYTSPHLTRFTERIVVAGDEIAKESVIEFVELAKPMVAALDAEGQPPTFFEITTALAFHYFASTSVDWAVVETGLGGRLDATNVLTPELAIITNVAFDHQRFLGEQIETIAAEKAGIMKPGVACVTGATDAALTVIKAQSHVTKSPMAILGEDYQLEVGKNLRLTSARGEAIYKIGPAGPHQKINAALAVMATDILRQNGCSISVEAVQRSLRETVVPGRLETVDTGPSVVLLDGAHNFDGAIALRQYFAEQDMGGFQLVVGFSDDKPWQQMLDQWAPLAAHVHCCDVRNDRAVDANQIADYVTPSGIPATAHPSVAAALDAATLGEQVVVAGSLFLIGEARAILLGEELEAVSEQ